jgi:ATP-binding cassette subfamily B protein
MIKYFQNKYAMSKKGAKDLLSSIIWSVMMDISFMVPIILAFLFINEYTGNTFAGGKNTILYYVILSVVAFAVMFIVAYFQYDSTYTRIYEESARRRINLAETLRKLPLAFFGKKDIADLSSTIMEDATQIEQLFSHSVPQIYAAVLLVLIMAVTMFFYNWQLSLAVFWVVPVALLVFWLSRKFQSRAHTALYHTKRDISDYMQEELDLAYE